jgi:hypothetical protein
MSILNKGLPFNITSYGLLLEIIAKEVNTLPILTINTEFWPTENGECGIGSLKTNLN